jgi:hypothetical protein
VPDNPARGQLTAVLADVLRATRELGGDTLVVIGTVGAIVAVVGAFSSARRSILLCPMAAAALPIAAFYQGHPFRIRYMVAVVVACGVLAGLAIAVVPRRLRVAAAVAVCVASFASRVPWDARAPMVTEAQWETPFRLERQGVSWYLDEQYDDSPILASMGSLAHYMQESASYGLRLRDFVHEGNGDLWLETIRSPRRHVRWVAIEARAEGGDTLAARLRQDAAFLDGFDQVAAGGGVLLFRRRE